LLTLFNIQKQCVLELCQTQTYSSLVAALQKWNFAISQQSVQLHKKAYTIELESVKKELSSNSKTLHRGTAVPVEHRNAEFLSPPQHLHEGLHHMRNL